VNCAVGVAPCLTAEDDQGYEVDEAEVVYWGRCPDCQPRSPGRAKRTGPPKASTSKPTRRR
jgi:Fur family ferric uptake transcriptional regulator